MVRLQPENAPALRNLGLLAWENREAEAALAYWRRGLRADPHHADLLDVLRHYAPGGTP
ncbi:MAG: hypothetical protein HKN12_09275 [Gemmatimonadetes bacterium]|nr:hypothetical protein [Gemmatimonadota bacterium]